MKNVTLIAFGFGLLVLQAVAATMIASHELAPNLLLPVVIYLGVAHNVYIVRGAAIAFVLGYLLDSFCGSPMGLQTFVLVSVFVVARFAGLRLFMRGPLLQIGLTFVVSVLAGGTILSLRAIFEPPAPFAAGSAWDALGNIVVPALSTALVAPLVFFAVRRIDGVSAPDREETLAA